jgi:hypothetical protein
VLIFALLLETKVYSGFSFRPNFLPRITLANIWEPASRESCDNNVWEIVKASFRILFGKSTLQVCRKLISGHLLLTNVDVLMYCEKIRLSGLFWLNTG